VPFVIRAKLPDGYRVPPHWHPTDENIVVISGMFMVGTGDKFDEASMTTLAAGGYAKMPKRMHHFAGARGETIIQVHGMGPFAITYVNPGDDPRKKTQ
jgi:quercetin dioxygenase-like cupin family protein